MTGQVTVLDCLAPVLIQDLGRPGLAAIGVPTSGAFDRLAMKLAQRLVGNDESAAGLEITMGAKLATSQTVTAVVTGAPTELVLGGRAVGTNEVFSWQPGATLTVVAPSTGLRNYLAVHGGFEVFTVLGSAATDVLSGLGPEPLEAGDMLALAGCPAAAPIVTAAAPLKAVPGRIPIVLGPRADWFSPTACSDLVTEIFTVTEQSNRIGLRLHGQPLARVRAEELPSEPLQRGAIQVPPSGQPIIMGPDHPTTGGYPVIATVVAEAWDYLAQLRPGDEVGFQAVAYLD